MRDFNVIYRFRCNDGAHRQYSITGTADYLTDDLPPWTALDFHQCANCPLLPEAGVRCPLAATLAPVVFDCNDLAAYDEVSVEVTTPERTISTQTTAQRAFSSLMGLLVVSSGCPHTAYLKPMARFHLPFSSDEETIYRASSMFLLAQYFRAKEGAEPDFQLQGLTRIYKNLQIVNQSIAERLRAAANNDSMVNSLVLLDLFAKSLPHAIAEELDELRELFDLYLSPKKSD
jgi:hypothetical protein